MPAYASIRTPTARLIIATLAGLALTIPLFVVFMLTEDRAEQSRTAEGSISAGWGGPQVVAGPVLVIPYRATRIEPAGGDNQALGQRVDTWESRTIAPEAVEVSTGLSPEIRTRSIYEAVVYEADMQGRAVFTLPADLADAGIDPARLDFSRAELHFDLTDPRGLGANPVVSANGAALRLQPGSGSGGAGRGFFARLDAGALATGRIELRFGFKFRGNRSLALAPQAGDTSWSVASAWPHPSFQGSFLPAEHQIGDDGFRASYRVGNLALVQSLVSRSPTAVSDETPVARIDLVQPVDLYAQVGRATKYGFLFIGFTLLALLLFDIVGGARVRAAEYLLVGAGLVLFFVLLLAFSEVIGFAAAYLIASAAITGLTTFYSAAVLRSWRRAGAVGALMVTLYGVLYLLLNLEAYSLVIGSVLLFLVLAGVMYLTRHLDWGGGGAAEPAMLAESGH